MFRHFHKLLILVRDLLRVLTTDEIRRLERMLVTGHNASSIGDDSVAHLRAIENEFETVNRRYSTAHIDALIGDNAHTAQFPNAHFKSNLAYVAEEMTGAEAVFVVDTPYKLNFDTKGTKIDRSAYGTAEDLIHRLFVCISGVADQLQSNYSSDVRRVLKMVLQPLEAVPVFEVPGKAAENPINEEETGIEVRESLPIPSFVGIRWVPDEDCDQCTGCQSSFTFVRRRHHCRNCGRIFCGACSSQSLTIPELGYERRVRVCDLCFSYRAGHQDQQIADDVLHDDGHTSYTNEYQQAGQPGGQFDWIPSMNVPINSIDDEREDAQGCFPLSRPSTSSPQIANSASRRNEPTSSVQRQLSTMGL